MAENTDLLSSDDPSSQSSDESTAPECGGALRRKYEAALAQVNELEAQLEAETGDLKTQLVHRTFADFGPSRDTGIGKAAVQTYDGEPEGLAEYVEAEYGYVPTNPMVAKIANGHAALDGLAAAAGSIKPPTQADELAKPERRGDTDTTIAMKGNQLGDVLRGT